MAEKVQEIALSPTSADDDFTIAQADPLDGDVALKAVQDVNRDELDLSDASFARVLFKVDRVLLPIMA
jgi:hypothetical protein